MGESEQPRSPPKALKKLVLRRWVTQAVLPISVVRLLHGGPPASRSPTLPIPEAHKIDIAVNRGKKDSPF